MKRINQIRASDWTLQIVLSAALLLCSFSASAQLPLATLRLPPGFEIELWVEDIDNARQMALGDLDTLFVGSRNEGKVYAVAKISGNQPKRVLVIASGLKSPSGLAFRDGDLYVADIDVIYRYRNIEANLPNWPQPEVVYDQLPSDAHHGWKNIAFGPDGDLYIPIGAPCNICDPGAPYASIQRLNTETGTMVPVALGVRNSVGFDWHPDTGQLWFTDNGRDLMGDDLPPCEINLVTEPGQHFGYPFLHGASVADPQFASSKPDNLLITPPALELSAHVAPLGLMFYRGQLFPEAYQNRILVAEHGSWNRSQKIGYRVMTGRVEGDKIVDYRPFIEGWLRTGDLVWGRPVAFQTLLDGSVLISDDYAGVIYRVTYRI